jgi:hypothetical protein
VVHLELLKGASYSLVLLVLIMATFCDGQSKLRRQTRQRVLSIGTLGAVMPIGLFLAASHPAFEV